ncbi:MAG: pyrroloquinoline quinone biosynthesis peptide chaperone PqqD [Rhodobacteraceae bacterium]|nr:pyrroloquinoline quinone biosynthesis peptide chaperone PqqD [Paracoccaceae bacterium]
MNVPVLPSGVRLHEDRVRNCIVLLGPERALLLDASGTAILNAVDGVRSMAEIAQELAQRFGAPLDAVRTDVEGFLKDLAARRLVDIV